MSYSANEDLQTADPELYNIIKQEELRQSCTINLIASENYAPIFVQQAKSSVFCNKYSEGYPNARYYGGTENCDQLELLCQKRALEAFNLDDKIWGVNVQTLSGTPANFAVYTALIGPNKKIMGMSLSSGGHLSHGFKTKTAKVSATSLFFESDSYSLNCNDELDYSAIKTKAKEFLPHILICGASAYPRDFDYPKFKEIADEVGAYFMCDMAHISAFVATKLMNNPFDYCDIVTTTTHKTMQGPRGALIFYRKEKIINNEKINVENLINRAVFPGLSGGPHNDTIAAVAAALKNMRTPLFYEYAKQTINNAKIMANFLIKKNYTLVTNGTDNHIVLVDLTNKGINGTKIQFVCDSINLNINSNAIPSTTNMRAPQGIRLGSPAITTRNFTEEDILKMMNILHSVINLTVEFDKKSEGNEKVFFELIKNSVEIENFKREIVLIAKKYPIPINYF